MTRARALLSDEGLAALRRFVQTGPLLAFDFDGTLAPIVARPDDAHVPAPTSQRLGVLAARLRVAVITGRTVADVVPRLGFAPWQVIGSHGAEDPLASGSNRLADALDGARAVLAEHAAALLRDGVSVEDKAQSIALHYRLAPHRAAALRRIETLTAGLGPQVAVSRGKMVVNLVPRAANDKAAALRVLLSRAGATSALFVGDDVNDEPVFEADEPGWFTVRVGTGAARTHARFVIESSRAMPRLLDELIAGLPAGDRP